MITCRQHFFTIEGNRSGVGDSGIYLHRRRQPVTVGDLQDAAEAL